MAVRSLDDIRKGVFTYGTRAGYNPTPVYGSEQYETQLNTKFLPMLQARSDMMRRAFSPTGANFNPWAGPSVIAPSVAGGQPVINPHQTISNTKNPQIKSILDKILGSVDQFAGADLNTNPYMLRKNTLDEGQEGRVQDLASSLPGMQQQQNQSLADFTKNYLQGINEAIPYQQQESAAIGEFYDKGPEGVQSRLDQLAKQREMSVAAAVERALERVRGQTNLQRLNLGDSSYLDSQAMRTAADIMAKEAIDQANLGRTNYLTVKEGQTNLADKRRMLLDSLNRMRLLPIQARTELTNANIGQQGAVGDMIRANNLYRVETPEDVIGRRLGVLGGAANIDLANTFYGVNKPYEPDFSGYTNPYYGSDRIGSAMAPYGGYDDLGYDAPRPAGQPTLTERIKAAQLADPRLTQRNYYPPNTPSGSTDILAPNYDPTIPTFNYRNPREEAYFNETGVYPNDDPFFSDYLYNVYLGGG